MREFFTGISAVAKGYSVSQAEMKFAPSGTAVTSVRIGCGGSDKRKATFIDVIAWGATAEMLNGMVEGKGVAVKASGLVSQRKWQYNGKWYERLELIYLTALEVQDGNELVDIPIAKRTGGKGETEGLQSTVREAVAEPISEDEAEALSEQEAVALAGKKK